MVLYYYPGTIVPHDMSLLVKADYVFRLKQSQEQFNATTEFLKTQQLLVVSWQKGIIVRSQKRSGDLLTEMEETLSHHGSDQLDKDTCDVWDTLQEKVDKALGTFMYVSKTIHAYALEAQSTHANAGLTVSTLRFHTVA